MIRDFKAKILTQQMGSVLDLRKCLLVTFVFQRI